MKEFDEMYDKARDAARTAQDAAKQVCDDASKYVERSKCRAKLNEAYRALGRAEYEAATSGVDSMTEINTLISRITALRRRMSEIERDLNRAGAVFCPSCGRQSEPEDAFCSACGAPLRRRKP